MLVARGYGGITVALAEATSLCMTHESRNRLKRLVPSTLRPPRARGDSHLAALVVDRVRLEMGSRRQVKLYRGSR